MYGARISDAGRPTPTPRGKDAISKAAPPFILGGVYCRLIPQTGLRVWATLSGAQERADGRIEGALRGMDTLPITVLKDSEAFSEWELVAAPVTFADSLTGQKSNVNHAVRTEALRLRAEARERLKNVRCVQWEVLDGEPELG